MPSRHRRVQPHATTLGNEAPGPRRTTSSRPQRRRLRLRVDRRAIIGLSALLGVAAVSTWFAGAVAEADQLRVRASAEQAHTDALRQRIEAGQREIELAQRDAFLWFEARALGLGKPGEHPFALAPGAPSPEPITPLGEAPEPLRESDPIEQALDLFLGR